MGLEIRSIGGKAIDDDTWAAIKTAGGGASGILQALRVDTFSLIVWERAGVFSIAKAARQARAVLAYYDRAESDYFASKRAGTLRLSGLAPEQTAYPRSLFSEAVRRLELAMAVYEEHRERPEIADAARRLLTRMTALNEEVAEAAAEYHKSSPQYAMKRQAAELQASAIAARVPPLTVVAAPPKVSARFNINGKTGEAGTAPP